MQQKEKGDHQNVARAALVIDVLSRSKERGMRLTDVVESTGLGTATIHRLLSGLVTYGFVDHDRASGRYFVGLRLVSWASVATERYGLAPFVDASLDRLARESEDTVYFSLMTSFDSICVDRREGDFPIKTLTLRIGDIRPLGIGAGSLALLAFQDDDFIAEVVKEDKERRKKFGITDKFLLETLDQTKRSGFALNDGKLISGMSGVAVPLRRGDGKAVAAISVAAITSRLTGERLNMIVNQLKSEALQIEGAAAMVLNTPFAKRHSRRGN